MPKSASCNQCASNLKIHGLLNQLQEVIVQQQEHNPFPRSVPVTSPVVTKGLMMPPWAWVSAVVQGLSVLALVVMCGLLYQVSHTVAMLSNVSLERQSSADTVQKSRLPSWDSQVLSSSSNPSSSLSYNSSISSEMDTKITLEALIAVTKVLEKTTALYEMERAERLALAKSLEDKSERPLRAEVSPHAR